MAPKKENEPIDPAFELAADVTDAVTEQAMIQAAAQIEAAEAAKRVKVKFFNGAGEDGRNDVLLGLNGHVLAIKREQVVEIPEAYLKVADCAVQTMYEGNGEAREVPRFPYQRM